MQILVYCPLGISYPRLYTQAIAALLEQTWPTPYEFACGVSVDATDADADRRYKVRRARQLALGGQYDAMLVVAHDVRIGKDTLARLYDVDAPVVSAVTVARTEPYEWQHGAASDCTLYRRAALHDEDDGDYETVADLYCTRLSMEYGGIAVTPDPKKPDRVDIHYNDPGQAPATVPYSRTILSKEAA